MSWRSRGVMSAARRKTGVRIVALLVLLLIIGAIAAGQRHILQRREHELCQGRDHHGHHPGRAAELPGGESQDQV